MMIIAELLCQSNGEVQSDWGTVPYWASEDKISVS